jgi:transcriptional regulator with XRE-family HTH domain
MIEREVLLRHIGSKLRMRRTELDLGMADLAATCGVSHQAVQKWEAGETEMGVHRLLQVSAALRVPVQFFYEGMYLEPEMVLRPEVYKRALQMARDIRNLDDREIKTAIKFIESVREIA